MSAIAGLVALDGRTYITSDLSGMLDVLAPLGRDGRGAWAGRAGRLGAALGAVRRLRVPEDAADAQPVVVAGGQVVVVADVVLTNRAELCRAVGLPDARDLADSVVVAHAYLRWGEACAERLRGEFAIAVADRRRGGVLLARDHTGIRPLHLYRGRGWWGFASTALAVTGVDGVPAAPDLERAKEFLALVMLSERSWVRDVSPVPAATAIWVDPGGARQWRFWEPEIRVRRAGTAAEHAEELRAVLDEAVRRRLRRVGGVGVLVSGGLDSTAVAAAVAAQVAPGPVRSYTSVPPPGWNGPAGAFDPDEGPLVRLLAARHPNLAPAFVDGRGAYAIDGDHEVYAAGGTPMRNTINMTWIRAAYRRAAADGVGVLFVGHMGNLGFSRSGGERWLLELMAAGRPGEAWREGRAWSAARGESLATTVRRSALAPLAPGWARHCWARWRSGPPPWPPIPTALRPELYRDVAARPMPWPDQTPLHRNGTGSYAEANAAFEARYGWRHADPTEDVELLELCLRQPAWARRHRGHDRAAARGAMAGLVPDEIRLREVRGAQLPDWLDRLTDAYAEVCAGLAAAHEHPPSRTLIDLERLDALVGDWPAPARAADRDVVCNYRMVLPRALAVSRYLHWLDEWARAAPARRAAAEPVRP